MKRVLFVMITIAIMLTGCALTMTAQRIVKMQGSHGDSPRVR